MSIRKRIQTWQERFANSDRNYLLREGGRFFRLYSHLEMSFLSGYALPPYSVSLWLTRRCNLNCSFCWVDQQGGEIETIYYLSLIDQLAKFGTRIGITGGEPLLRDDCVEIIGYAKERGLKVGLNTNGLLLNRHSRGLLETKLDNISISIDAPSEIHDEIRGLRGAYNTTLENTKNLLKLRDKMGLSQPKVRVLITICKRNLSHIPETIRELDGLGLDGLVIQHLWFTTGDLVEKNNLLLKEHLNCSSHYLSQFIIDEDIPDGEEVRKTLFEIESIKTETPLISYPQLSEKDIITFYNNPEKVIKRSCHSRWFRVDIMPGGDVTPCLGYVVGNIKDEPFWKIWNNERFRRLRRFIERENTIPGCNRCCGLFSE